MLKRRRAALNSPYSLISPLLSLSHPPTVLLSLLSPSNPLPSPSSLMFSLLRSPPPLYPPLNPITPFFVPNTKHLAISKHDRLFLPNTANKRNPLPGVSDLLSASNRPASAASLPASPIALAAVNKPHVALRAVADIAAAEVAPRLCRLCCASCTGPPGTAESSALRFTRPLRPHRSRPAGRRGRAPSGGWTR